MLRQKRKYLTYILLIGILVVSFLLANLLINLISLGKISPVAISYLLLNIALNFVMFFITYQFFEQVEEKKQIIDQLQNQINELQKPTNDITETADEKTINPDETAQQLIPATLQNLTISQFFEKILSNLGKISQISCGIAYLKDNEGFFKPIGTYAFYPTEPIAPFAEGESLPGQVVKDKKPIYIQQVPQNYMRIVSGLGQSSPQYIYIFPILNKDEVISVVELASFVAFDYNLQQILDKLANLIGKIIVKINKQ